MFRKIRPEPYHVGRIVFNSGSEAVFIIDTPDASGVAGLVADIAPHVKAVRTEQLLHGQNLRINRMIMKILDVFDIVEKEPFPMPESGGTALQFNPEAAKA